MYNPNSSNFRSMLPTSSSVCVLSALTYEAIKKRPADSEALASSHKAIHGRLALSKPIILFPCKLTLVSMGFSLVHCTNCHSLYCCNPLTCLPSVFTPITGKVGTGYWLQLFCPGMSEPLLSCLLM